MNERIKAHFGKTPKVECTIIICEKCSTCEKDEDAEINAAIKQGISGYKLAWNDED